jgi:hypothetical protein
MARRDSASKKLSELFKTDAGKLNEKLRSGARELISLVEPEADRDEPDWNDPILHGLIASSALTLVPGNRFSAPVETAFKKAKLDPINPLSWRLLLDLFCWAHFGETKRRGAPGKWNADRYCQLLQDFDLKKSGNPSMSDRRVCEFLGQQPQYQMKNGKPLSPDRLMKVLKKARNPEFNINLKSGVDRRIEALRRVREHWGLEWSAEHEARATRTLIEQNCRDIASSWRSK